MIKTLVELLREPLTHYDLFRFVRVFLYSEFRALMALLLSFAIVLALGRRTIRWLLKQKIGDNPEFYNKDLNQLMKQKANIPTMGGILICGAILASTVLLADLKSFYIQMGMICLLWLFLVGLFDDWLKLTSARRKPGSREGLYSAEKLLLQLGLAVVLGIFIYHHGQNKFTSDPEQLSRMSTALNLPFLKTWTSTALPREALPSPDLIVLGKWTFVLLTIVVITGSSNAVNLTDGMDGLAGGTMSIVAFAFAVLAWIAGQEIQAKHLLVPYIPQSDELAVMAAAMVGACLGFLWFNCHPAQVFMGDTGSLALGGLIGYIAVVIRQEFLLLIIGGIFVLEAVSVMLQVGYFKFTKGKRIFKCAPIHHHFHLSGWTEQQVVVRFWLISAILAAVALATLKLR
ncbi:MAG: phospho-N-acetylmuramoyl-pentapeptide-transferase [Planctomycetota bacterium]|nr:phospho-N-acetylmuramoyl-pentapeptide-transferase [Planctomycetota bacterium]